MPQSAGYIAYDPSSSRFTLPAAHMPVLVQESGPMFFGGIHQWVTALARQIEPIIQALMHRFGKYATRISEAEIKQVSSLLCTLLERPGAPKEGNKQFSKPSSASWAFKLLDIDNVQFVLSDTL